MLILGDLNLRLLAQAISQDMSKGCGLVDSSGSLQVPRRRATFLSQLYRMLLQAHGNYALASHLLERSGFVELSTTFPPTVLRLWNPGLPGPVLEIGSYCGYSAIRLALSGRGVVTLETDPIHAVIARWGSVPALLEEPTRKAQLRPAKAIGLCACMRSCGRNMVMMAGLDHRVDVRMLGLVTHVK